ncbi:hypothetical protein BGW80DRAFT_1469026 [Lactifluus volemus]|nr:hypothetical protein BGW80DRAFT_1469026 [Lactifluus volemus]
MPSALSEPMSTNFDCDNPWAPFPNRLAFDWAYYHYVQLQSSQNSILTGLDLWRAAVIESGLKSGSDNGGIPWKRVQDIYNTIDSIQAGGALLRFQVGPLYEVFDRDET